MPRSLTAALLATLCGLTAAATDAAEYNLTPSAKAGQAYQVEVQLKVGGDLTVRDLDAAPATQKEGEEQAEGPVRKLPMSVEGRLAYEEAPLAEKQTARHYSVAMATIKVGDGGKTPNLTDGRRLVVAEQTPQGVKLACPNGPLTREQLDLIDVVGGTPFLDGLLPGESLPEGKAWAVDGEVMGALLGLDSVSVCEISNVIDEGTAGYVKFQVAGVVHGEVEGATTEFDIRGLGLFDRHASCVTRLNLAIKEKRSLGPATPGFVGVAKINIKRDPISKPEFLIADALAAAKGQTDANLVLPSQDLGFEFQHDRSWFVASAGGPRVSLRRMHEGALVAQATITRLPSKAGVEPSLKQFEADVRSSIGGAFSELISAGEWTNQAGCGCLGVIARGKVDDIELEHRHYLVRSPGDGRTVSLVVTLAAGDLAAVADADKLLADAARPLGSAVAQKATNKK
ncbi:hypothetical protein Pla123a_48330 [Posidoniimonas polymericola]|uniref:SLA1 homology domain-containing protein n=1 Tax=Posidoniimonas polymericola TaxID=2528002 RepID=A0A5C5XWB6_9BACT|nr:hypothetical protein [Posidoniimonas polymericola]TWT65922.1 hypothetical protein Pla123a_48330 [Posidoniimonas polymericola]